jgi:phosphomevalonate kinase
VLAHYLPVQPDLIDTETGKLRIHNLAQAAHCAAQGKIGSGFDVAAAVYGACKYRRFDPGVLQEIGEAGSAGFAVRLHETVNDNGAKKIWNTEIDKTSAIIPRSLRLVMCDVDCGSETPGLVRKVFEWRKKNAEDSERLWTTLQKENENLAQILQDLSKDELAASLYDLQAAILKVRSLIREMSEKAGVPIEPKVQTELIDACCRQVQGVIGGLVPGAGGYDAVAFLINDHQQVIDDLNEYLSTHQVSGGENEQQRIGKVRLLSVKQDMLGVRKEAAGMFDGWL